MITRWGFTVPGGLIDNLLKEYAIHQGTVNYTLNGAIKNRVLVKMEEIEAQLNEFGVMKGNSQ